MQKNYVYRINGQQVMSVTRLHKLLLTRVAAASVDLEITIFPSKSLFKPREQYRPLSRGQLDMTVFHSLMQADNNLHLTSH